MHDTVLGVHCVSVPCTQREWTNSSGMNKKGSDGLYNKMPWEYEYILKKGFVFLHIHNYIYKIKIYIIYIKLYTHIYSKKVDKIIHKEKQSS